MIKLSYKEKYKRIKKFVNFKHDLRYSENKFKNKLSLKEKRRISHYFKVLFGEPNTDIAQGAVNLDVYLYRPRSEKRKRLAKDYAQIKGQYKDLKIIPIPRANPEKEIKFNFKNSHLEVKESHIIRHVSYFNLKNLAKNPEKEIERVINILNKRGMVQAITPLSGAREIMKAQTNLKETITRDIINLMQKYSENFEKWLLGLAGYEFTDQADFVEYSEARKKDKKSRKKCLKCGKKLTKKDKGRVCNKCRK